MIRYFATCAPGLEPVLADELRADTIGAADVEPGSSGVAFTGDRDTGYRANLWLRTAIRVLAELDRAPVDGPEALYDWARGLPWERWMTVDQTLSVDARVWDSAITHSRYAAFRIKDAICDRFRDRCGDRPDVDVADAHLPLFLYVYENRATLYRDLSGQTLHKRGYRSAMHKSSLNECVAAGIVLMSGFDGTQDFADPMCGSGTIPIEAALIAQRRAPGLFRKTPFPFERWPDFDRRAWGEIRAAAKAEARPLGCRIAANERHPGAASLARRDVAAAGLGDVVTIAQGDAETWEPPFVPQWVVTNPPWGERLSDASEASWRTLGGFLKARCGGAQAWLLSGNAELTQFLRMKATRRIPIRIGKFDCRLIRYDVRARAPGEAPPPRAADRDPWHRHR